MTSQQIDNHRENAEIYNGEAICKQKSHDLLSEINLPNGLLPLNDLIEVSYNRTTGFVWLKQKKKTEHRFREISKNVAYEDEVTAFVEERRMRRVTGVKSKEILIWVTISDIYVEERDGGENITFANPRGLSRTFPVSAFQVEEDVDDKNKIKK